jgi:hypothetical protein
MAVAKKATVGACKMHKSIIILNTVGLNFKALITFVKGLVALAQRLKLKQILYIYKSSL